MDAQATQFSTWIGNTECHRGTLTLVPVQAMAATLCMDASATLVAS